MLILFVLKYFFIGLLLSRTNRSCFLEKKCILFLKMISKRRRKVPYLLLKLRWRKSEVHTWMWYWKQLLYGRKILKNPVSSKDIQLWRWTFFSDTIRYLYYCPSWYHVFSFWISHKRVTLGTFPFLASIMRRKRRALRMWCEQTPWTLRWPPAVSPSRWRKTYRQDFFTKKLLRHLRRWRKTYRQDFFIKKLLRHLRGWRKTYRQDFFTKILLRHLRRWRKTYRQDFFTEKNFCGITEFCVLRNINKGMAIYAVIAKCGLSIKALSIIVFEARKVFFRVKNVLLIMCTVPVQHRCVVLNYIPV